MELFFDGSAAGRIAQSRTRDVINRRVHLAGALCGRASTVREDVLDNVSLGLQGSGPLRNLAEVDLKVLRNAVEGNF